MPLTPADIHNMAFRKSSLARRGYDEEEVDALLDVVTQEMIQLLEENNDLRNQAHRDGAAGARETTPGRTAAADLSAISDELDRACRARDRAEQNAQSLRSRLADIRRAAAAEAPAEPAGAGTDRVLAVAQQTAEQHVQSAYQEAHELLRDASEESERITQHARRTARDIAEDSRRRDSSAVDELQNRHTALQQEVAELADFAAQYRAALEHHIRRQGQI